MRAASAPVGTAGPVPGGAGDVRSSVANMCSMIADRQTARNQERRSRVTRLPAGEAHDMTTLGYTLMSDQDGFFRFWEDELGPALRERSS